jgi:RecJ-like exonuclease
MTDMLVRCKGCDGKGELRTSHRFDCPDCDGKGVVLLSVVLEREAKAKARREEREKREGLISKIKTLSTSDLEAICERCGLD